MQRAYIALLIDDKHRKRTDDVESRYQKNKKQDKKRNPFFYLHHIIGRSLLLQTVANPIAPAQMVLQTSKKSRLVDTVHQTQFECSGLGCVIIKLPHERQRSNHPRLIVLLLIDGKDSRSIHLFFSERSRRIGHIDTDLAFRGIKPQRARKKSTHFEPHRNSRPQSHIITGRIGKQELTFE